MGNIVINNWWGKQFLERQTQLPYKWNSETTIIARIRLDDISLHGALVFYQHPITIMIAHRERFKFETLKLYYYT